MTIITVTTEAEWLAARAIRQRVFVEEQECPPEHEWDEHDWPAADCSHLLLLDDGVPVGTARWRAVDYEGSPAAKLERFAVLPQDRGRGYGRLLVEAAMHDAREAGLSRFVLHAQAYLEDFYAGFGFQRVGEDFDEVGIPHVKMDLTS